MNTETPSTPFRQGFIEGVSYCADDASRLLAKRFDAMILASSWDSRCLCSTRSESVGADFGIAIFFEEGSDHELRKKHDPILRDFIGRVSIRNEMIRVSSLMVEKWWRQIYEKIVAFRREKGRPLSILLDCSAAPRFFTLAMLANCIRRGVADEISIFYSEGVYPAWEEEQEAEVAFTEGGWRTVAVPLLEGRFRPDHKRFYLVSVGFEGWKTLRVVSRADPDRVSILFPNPAVLPEYVERTRKDNRKLIDEYLIPPEQIIEAHAGDAIEAWRTLAQAGPDRPNEENSYYLCCGTKPHAVALGLRALALGFPTVLYNIPDRHSVVDIQPAGVFWRYDIRDVASIRRG